MTETANILLCILYIFFTDLIYIYFFYNSPIFVGEEESSANQTAVGILAFSIEDLLVMIVIVQVDGSIKGQHNDLGDLL